MRCAPWPFTELRCQQAQLLLLTAPPLLLMMLVLLLLLVVACLQVFRHVVITLYLFQGVMIVILAVKQFVWAVLVVVPVVLTAFVHRLGADFLQRSWGVMSMRAAYELDLLDAAAACQQPAEQQHADAKVPSQQQQQQSAAWGELYRPPGQRVLLQGPGIEARLAQQVAAMQQRLAEHNEVAATNAKRR